MTTQEKPPETPFWTWDIIVLLAINIVFILTILIGLVAIALLFGRPLVTWLTAQ